MRASTAAVHMIAGFHEDRRNAAAVALHADGCVEARADGADDADRARLGAQPRLGNRDRGYGPFIGDRAIGRHALSQPDRQQNHNQGATPTTAQTIRRGVSQESTRPSRSSAETLI